MNAVCMSFGVNSELTKKAHGPGRGRGTVYSM